MKKYLMVVVAALAAFAITGCTTTEGNTNVFTGDVAVPGGRCVPGEVVACGNDEGACVAGRLVCGENGRFSDCLDHVGPSDEECGNFADDDCDGVAENGCELCQFAKEECDRRDNNCNGSVDEGCECHGGDRDCGDSVGECTTGIQRCEDGEWGLCDGDMPDAEECDGRDNNCNSTVDEDCDCQPGAERPCGEDMGECTTGTQECNDDGYWDDCSGTAPDAEDCDGLDNDCDTIIDEDCDCIPGDMSPCGIDTGECVSGNRVCNDDGYWGACEDGFVSPDAEICGDDVDNDCDTSIDESCPCVDLDVRSCGPDSNVGTCRQGTQTCDDGVWSACLGSIFPAADTCGDRLDSDCNGIVDDGCACTPAETMACGSNVGACSEGLQTCTIAGTWGDCLGETGPDAEDCNSLDDDCDGSIDEGCDCIPGDAMPCGNDVGACVSGTQTCNADGYWGACGGVGYIGPDSEVCDGVDNDCDADTDEGCLCNPADPPLECNTGMCGTCARGLMMCQNGGHVYQCEPTTFESTEVCGDGWDGDCDCLSDAADPDCP